MNDVAALNIDASFVRRSGRKKAFDEDSVFEMQNGCICCTLRTDLVKAIAELATGRTGVQYDAIVVEASGVSEPAQIGEMFQIEFMNAAEDEESLRNARDKNAMAQVLNAMKGASSLEEIVRLDTCITVVDCSAFNGDITTPEDLRSRFDVREENGERSVATLLAEQIEFADLIVLNKCD